MNKSFRIAAFVAVAFFFITSRMFNEVVLKKIPGALSYDAPTDQGHMIGAVLMALVYIIISFLVEVDWI
jgi:hypothetical protein